MAAQDGARRPQRLIFITNSSNPLTDSKKPETRKMVSKWAMINRPDKPTRPKHPNNATSSPESATSSTSASSSILNRDRSPSDSVSSGISQASTSPTASSVHSSASLFYPVSDSPPIDHARDITISDTFSKVNADYYSLATAEEELPLRPRYPLDEADPRYAEARQRHQARSKAIRKRTHEPQHPGMELLDPAKTSESSMSVVRRFAGTNAAVVTRVDPLTFLTNSEDPFDCLPVKHDPHTQELLFYYLHAQFLSPAFTQGSIEITQRVKNYRQSTWFPLILGSKVTLNALVAYIESTPDLPVKAKSQDFILSHVQAAYEGMRQALSNPKTETDDAICVAVVLLMLTAQRLGDIATFRAHATGLTQLLAARSKAFRYSKRLRDQENEKWSHLNFTINGAPTSNPCRFCQDAALRPVSERSSSDSPDSSPPHTSDDHPSDEAIEGPAKPFSSQPRGSGFYELIEKGFLSPNLSKFIEQILIWSRLAEQARQDRLSASAAATHAWVDERPGRLPPLDTACQYSVRLCLLLATWLGGGHSCSIVRRMTFACYASLRSPTIDIPRILDECPQALLWLSFVAGPFVEEDMQQQWLMCLLVRARHAVSPNYPLSFSEAHEYVSNVFIWANSMTPGARRFWDENSWDVGTATAWMENPF